ncbi:MAG: nucleotidyltransferase family protein [Rhodobacteraceae bacterium]|nr:nucleotidyltransferase family protein [Paracoccaceae bacterium]
MARVAILIPAAGLSSRMRGRDKLLEQVDERPLLRRQAEIALATGSDVLVTLRPDADARREVLGGCAVRIVDVPDADEGMSASIRRGVAAMGVEVDGAMILPADMPELTTEDLQDVLRAFTAAGADRITRGASNDGKPGHPVIFPKRLFPGLQEVSGDEGARALVKSEGAETVPLPDCHALTDLDTPEAWGAWRGKQSE